MKKAISFSATITIVISFLLTLLKELFEPIHNYLNHLTSNHWLSHSLIDIILFIILTMLFLIIKLKKDYFQLLFYSLLFCSFLTFVFFVYMAFD